MKISIIIVSLLIGAGVIFYLQNNLKTSPDDQKITMELLKNEQTVVYTNEGFIPNEISIKTGQIVKFINQSDRKMWIASDDHPSHNIYPEFDQKDMVNKGGSYEFKFDKEGSWGFHNHLYSNHLGKIIVRE